MFYICQLIGLFRSTTTTAHRLQSKADGENDGGVMSLSPVDAIVYIKVSLCIERTISLLKWLNLFLSTCTTLSDLGTIQYNAFPNVFVF